MLYLSADQLLMVTLQGPPGGGGGLLRYTKYHMAATVTLHSRSTPPDSHYTQLLLSPSLPLASFKYFQRHDIQISQLSSFVSNIKGYLICKIWKSGIIWPLGQRIVSSRSGNWPCSIEFLNWLNLDFLLVVCSFQYGLVETRCPKWRQEKI